MLLLICPLLPLMKLLKILKSEVHFSQLLKEVRVCINASSESFMEVKGDEMSWNVRCKQKYIFYYHLHELVKWVEQCSWSSPWLRLDNSLWESSSHPRGAISASEPSRSPRISHKIASSHCEMPCPERSWTFLPVYNLDLGTPQYHHRIPRGEELSVTTTGPLNEDQTFLQDHHFNRTTSITPIRLLPTPWPTGCHILILLV